MKLRSSAIVALPLALALILGACSSSSDTATTDTTEAVTDTPAVSDTGSADTASTDPAALDTIPADAAFNAGDVTFAQGMIPHHQQAVEMATIALDPARNAGAKVKDLAGRIQGAQDPEIKLMTGWLSEWGQPVDGMGAMNMDGMEMADMPGMEGMMTTAEMTGLESATGAAFDKMWLDMMVRHHQGAVAMSKTAETDAKAAVVKELAAKIVAAQEAEIAEMQKLLAA